MHSKTLEAAARNPKPDGDGVKAATPSTSKRALFELMLMDRSGKGKHKVHSLNCCQLRGTVHIPDSVLLGLHPPATLSAAASSKLNEVLTPNPFDRPRAAFVVEVRGVQDSRPLLESDLLKDARRKVVPTSEKVIIQIPDEEVSVVSIDEFVRLETDSFTDEEIHNFSRQEFESELVERFGSLVKMPLLKSDRDPLPDSVKLVLEEGISLYNLHTSRHGR